jgi:hypothetical protein
MLKDAPAMKIVAAELGISRQGLDKRIKQLPERTQSAARKSGKD